MTEHPSVASAKKALTVAMEAIPALMAVVDSMESTARKHAEREHELTAKLRDLQRRVDDAEQRAILYEQRSDSLAGKAEREGRLDTAAEKLLAALDHLPLKMEDAHIIPGATKPAIEFYGTYEWQEVMQAKFALKAAMKKGEPK